MVNATDEPLHRRLLALLDVALKEDEVTASGLATQLSAPVSEVEAELRALVRFGSLTRHASSNGEARYSVSPKRKKIGEMLIAAGHMTKAQLEEALAEQGRTGERLGRILLDRGYVSKAILGNMLAAQHGIPYVNLSTHRRDGHPHRTGGREDPHPRPRRRAPDRQGRPAPIGVRRDHLPAQGAGRHRHRRADPPAGRPHPGHHRRARL